MSKLNTNLVLDTTPSRSRN